MATTLNNSDSSTNFDWEAYENNTEDRKYDEPLIYKQGIAIVEGDYDNRISYEYTDFSAIKPEMMKEAISNAQKTAKQFAENSESKLGKIQTASQGQFSIQDRDTNTPYIKDI